MHAARILVPGEAIGYRCEKSDGLCQDKFDRGEAGTKLPNSLVSTSGLGLSSYRHDLSAGSVNVSHALEAFLREPKAYDFSRDTQKRVLHPRCREARRAASHGVCEQRSCTSHGGRASCGGRIMVDSSSDSGYGMCNGAFHGKALVSPMKEPNRMHSVSLRTQERMQVLLSNRVQTARYAKVREENMDIAAPNMIVVDRDIVECAEDYRIALAALRIHPSSNLKELH